MTIASNISKTGFIGSNSAGPFLFGFKFYQNGEIIVVKTDSTGVETILSEGTDYTLSGAGLDIGGSVTLTAVLATGEALSVSRVLDILQGTAFANQGAFYPELHETALDKLTMMVQQVNDNANDALNGMAAVRAEVAGIIPENVISSQLYAGAVVVVPGNYDSLENARTAVGAAGKTVLVLSALTQAQSNISGAWPADRGLEIRFGGSLLNSTAFTFTDARVFSSWQGHVFKGAGAVTGLKESRPEYFGANTTPGTTNMTAAAQSAISSLSPGGILRLSNTTYLLSGSGTQLLLATKPIIIEGQGATSILYVAGSVGATVDVLRIAPDLADSADGAFFALRDFAIIPVLGTPARDAIRLDVTVYGKHLKNMTIERLKLEKLGGRGINVVNPTNIDGLYTSTIRDNLIVGGIYLDKAGDSMRVLNNTLTGAGWGIYANLVAGANSLLIQGNNITSNEGSVYISGATATDARIIANNFEMSTPSTGTDHAMVLVDCSGDLHRTTTIAYNTFSMLESTVLVGAYIKSAQYTKIEHNYFGRSDDVTQTGVKTSAAVVNTVIANNYITGAEEDGGIDDAGVGTRGVYKPITLTSPFVNHDALLEGPTYYVDASGMITLTATVNNGGGAWNDSNSMFTLPATARPKLIQRFAVPCFETSVGYGTAVVQVNPSGTVTIYAVNGRNIAWVALNGISYHVYQ